MPGYPFNEDVIYDDAANQQSIVMTYTHGNSRLVDGHMTTNRSQVGVMKLNRRLGITMMKYYWSPDMYENNGVRIKRNPADDAYIIACNVRDSNGGKQNIAQLKTDKSGSPLHYYRYNTNRDAGVSGLVTSYDAGMGMEYYDMVGYRKGSRMLADHDLRIMATNASGSDCGGDLLQVLDSNYEDSVQMCTYAPEDTSGYWSITMWQDFLYFDNYDCATISNASSFRQAPSAVTASSADRSLSVYPTVLSAQASELTIESKGSENITAALYSYDGRCIARYVSAAAVTVKWMLPDLPSGSYTVKLSQGNNYRSFRITKL